MSARASHELVVLLVAAMPNRYPPLPRGPNESSARVEIAKIQEVLEMNRHGARVRVRMLLSATWSGLRQALLSYKPNIVHIIAHGVNGELELEFEQGGVHRVAPAPLATLFSVSRETLRLVLYSSCNSASMAEATSATAGCSIGFESDITGDDARHFAMAFYGTIAAGKAIEEAFTQATSALQALASQAHPQIFSKLPTGLMTHSSLSLLSDRPSSVGLPVMPLQKEATHETSPALATSPEVTRADSSVAGKSYRTTRYITVTGLLLIAATVIAWEYFFHLSHIGDNYSRVTDSSTVETLSTPIAPLAPGEKPVIAVLPFKNLGGDVDQNNIAEGMAESIRRQLLPFNQFAVSSNNTISDHKEQNVLPAGLWRPLRAHYVLQGSVQRSDDTVRVTARLSDTRNKELWSDSYDRDLTAASHFAIQDDITANVVGTVAGNYGIIVELEQARRKHGITELATYDCVLMSFSYYRKITQEKHRTARDCLEQALLHEPNSFEVLTVLAWIYLDEARFGYNPRPGSDPLQQALDAALRAVENARRDAQAHLVLAAVYFMRHDMDEFRREAEEALKLSPNDSAVLSVVGQRLAYAGEWERGLSLAKKAIELDPIHPGWFYFVLFIDHYRKGEYESARVVAEAVDMPEYFRTYLARAAVYGQLELADKAQKAVAKLLELKPDYKHPEVVRAWFQTWNHPEDLVEHLMDGLRKAKLFTEEAPHGPQSP